MNNQNVLPIIINSALSYNKELNEKNILFVLDDYSYLETYFNGARYKHLVGIDSQLSAHEFYIKCITHTLAFKDFSIKKDGSTVEKLQVINQLINIDKTAKMAGIFDGNRINLQTDKLVGNISATIGFIKNEKYYVPNTLLKDDIRQLSAKPIHRIIAIVKKRIRENEYPDWSYMSSKADLEKLNKIKTDIFHQSHKSDI